MRRLVVDPQVCRRARGGEPIDGDPGQDLVVGPWVLIRPVVELLIDPRQKSDGRVGEAVAESLRLGALFQTVAGAFFEEPAGTFETSFIASTVGGEGVLKGEERVLCPFRGAVGADHVDVRGYAGFGEEEADCAGDHVTPIT